MILNYVICAPITTLNIPFQWYWAFYFMQFFCGFATPPIICCGNQGQLSSICSNLTKTGAEPLSAYTYVIFVCMCYIITELSINESTSIILGWNVSLGQDCWHRWPVFRSGSPIGFQLSNQSKCGTGLALIHCIPGRKFRILFI